MVNFTCPVHPEKPQDPKPFYYDGQLNFKAHDVGWLICGIFALISTICSIWLIWKHLTYYTLPSQQRHIVRLIIMVPIYAIVSFMSYLFYRQALYYQTIRDCYEAVLVTSFFYLILAYTGDTRAEQHAVFRNVKLKNWFWPLGRWKYHPDGMHFLWLMKIWVLQYAIVRPVCTLVAVGLEYFGYYCLASWMPWFGHLWCALLISISVTIAMYCLIQFYLPIKELVDPYKPVLKFLAIKTIVFITFWQDTFLSFLVSFDVIKEMEYFSAEEIQVGINALLQCFWMLLFGFVHIKAFSYLPYRPADKKRTTLRRKAFVDVLDFRDWYWEMKESTQYVAARSKGKNFTLAEDIRADRHTHLEKALGKERKKAYDREVEEEKEGLPSFWKRPLDHDDPNQKDATDLEKLAEADGLLSGSRRDSDAGQSLDYVQHIYSEGGEDLYPELTQYHHPHSRHLTNVPSLELPFSHGKELTPIPEGLQGVKAHGREKGWWRSFRERISGSGHDEEKDLEPLNEPRMGQVNEGSWGDLRGRYREEETSPITPEAESPLSRLINTHRDSLTPKNRRVAVHSLAPAKEPEMASHHPSIAPSQQASLLPTESNLSRKPTASTSHPSASQTFATVPEQELITLLPLTKTQLPEKTGPKGKSIKIVIPSPLSPSRYPYGQEGAAVEEKVHVVKEERESSLRWSEPKKEVKETGMITIGAMSLAQTRAKAAQSQSSKQEDNHSKKAEGRINLPAPSQLSSPDDPFMAGVKTVTPPSVQRRPPAVRKGISVTSHNTAFEVGDVVSRGEVRVQQGASDRYTNVPSRVAYQLRSSAGYAQGSYQARSQSFQGPTAPSSRGPSHPQGYQKSYRPQSFQALPPQNPRGPSSFHFEYLD